MNKMTFRKTILSAVVCISLFSAAVSAQWQPVKHPEWSRNATIYEVNVRQYTPEGTFKAFEKHLPELKSMGVGILWLMPVHPIGEKKRKGSLGSYYAVRDYKKINPEFGTLADFKHLVGKAHSMGMYVIIDWVANHTAPDHRWVTTHPEYYTKDSTGNFVSPYDWTDVLDLNYDNKGLQEEMAESLEYWVKECNIDGYRCDVAAMVPTEFWNMVRPRLEKIKPVFMLAEAHENYLHKYAFDMTYNWQLKDLMNDIAKVKKNALDIDKYYEQADTAYGRDDYRMNFTTNHDENSWNGTEYQRLNGGVECFTALTFIVEGMPLIYSGQEAGMNKALRFFDKDTIVWKKDRMREIFTKLISLKKKNPALANGVSGGAMLRLFTGNDENIYAVARIVDGRKVIGIFNLSSLPQKASIRPAVSLGLAGSYRDVIKQTAVTLENRMEYSLAPWEYIVLEDKR